MTSGDPPPAPPTLPPEVEPDALLLTPFYRLQLAQRFSAALYFITLPILTGVTAVKVLQWTGLSGGAAWGLWATVLGGTLVVVWTTLLVRNRLLGKALKDEVTQSLVSRGRLPGDFGGHFVQISPLPVPRAYDGLAVWDLGWYRLDGPWLSYIGDRTAFSLHAGRVHGITLGPALPTLPPLKPVCLTLDGPTGTPDTLSLYFVEGGPLLNPQRRLPHWLDTLHRWRAAAPPGDDAPPPLPPYTFPGEYGLDIRGSNNNPLVLLVIPVLMAVLPAFLSVTLQLPFHTFSPLSFWPLWVLTASVQMSQFLRLLLVRDTRRAFPEDPKPNTRDLMRAGMQASREERRAMARRPTLRAEQWVLFGLLPVTLAVAMLF